MSGSEMDEAWSRLEHQHLAALARAREAERERDERILESYRLQQEIATLKAERDELLAIIREQEEALAAVKAAGK